MKRIRATALVIDKDRIIVMHRHKNGEEYFVLPGGSVENNEKVEDAALRELLEETSITGKLESKIFSFMDHYETEHQLFLVTHITGEPKLHPDSIEVATRNKNNVYEPMWIDKSLVEKLLFYPEGTKEFLLNYLK